MAVEWRDVFSSRAAAVGYDDQSQELLVRWVKGRVSIYGPGVPFEEFDSLSKSASVGETLNSQIIPAYAHRYQ
jgi:KTSC domain